MTETITVHIDQPPVIEEIRALLVRCGESTVEVKEAGHVSSGCWAAWIGGAIIAGGKTGDTYAAAVTAARDRVQADERRRLAHVALGAEL